MNEEKRLHDLGGGAVFPMGEKNTAFAAHFSGQSYLAMLTDRGVSIANVTFAPACRNDWHVHRQGGQILLVTGGGGTTRPGAKTPGRCGQHSARRQALARRGARQLVFPSAIEVPTDGGSTGWLEPVDGQTCRCLH